MKSLSVKFLVLCLLSALSAPLSAAGLDSKLEATARKLTEAAAARKITAATLAVFPFQADEKLSKKRVNFAVSEILTKNLLKLGKFTVIERAQLEEVMKEQKLGASGAVDSATAVEIGKLAGAKLLVLGNVIQLGNSYQLTSKLVDAETGEMIASEITEVPVKTFDEDADRYLVLVPEYQAIGIYLLESLNRSAVKKLPPVSAGGYTITPTNPDHVGAGEGVGLRFFPSPKWMIDVAIVPEFWLGSGGEVYTTSPVTGASGTDALATEFRFVLDRVGNLSPKFKTHIGLGGLSLALRTTRGDDAQDIRIVGNNVVYLSPLVRLGLEWKPLARVGWAVFGQYNVLKTDYKIYADVSTGGGNSTRVLVNQFAFPQIMIETTLALYF